MEEIWCHNLGKSYKAYAQKKKKEKLGGGGKRYEGGVNLLGGKLEDGGKQEAEIAFG